MHKINEILINFKENKNLKEVVKMIHSLNLSSELILSINHQKKPFNEYSSWILIHFTDLYPEISQNHQKEIIDIFLETKNLSIERNILYVLRKIPIIDYKDGLVLDKTILLIHNSEIKIATKVYALLYLMKFIEIYPELENELELAKQSLRKYDSPFIKSVLKKLK